MEQKSSRQHQIVDQDDGAVEAILLEHNPTAMKFFTSTTTNESSTTSTLLDVSNFPLLSTQYVTAGSSSSSIKTPSNTIFPPAADNMQPVVPLAKFLCHSSRARQQQEEEKQSISPPKDVAELWLQGGSSKKPTIDPPPGFSRQPNRSTRVKFSDSSSTKGHCRRYRSPPPPARTRRFLRAFKTKAKMEWKSAVDPKSKRTYYYNSKTNETQWRKPIELATPSERNEMEEKERKQKEFFAAMETNILASMAVGQPAVKTPEQQANKSGGAAVPSRPNLGVRTISTMNESVLRDLIQSTNRSIGKLNGLDTVLETKGEMTLADLVVLDDDDVSSSNAASSESLFQESSSDFGLTVEQAMALKELAKVSEQMATLSEENELSIEDLGASVNFEGSSLDFSDRVNMELSESADMDFSMSSGLDLEPHDMPAIDKTPKHTNAASTVPSRSPLRRKEAVRKVPAAVKFGAPLDEKPDLLRRNTCGTIYVSSTMSAPDKDATIKCVCGVYRAHILASAKQEQENDYVPIKDKYRKFNDRDSQRKSVSSVSQELSLEDLQLDEGAVPSLEEITLFYRDVFQRAQMEPDCIIMSLIYVERLIKSTKGLLLPRKCNWRSILFSALMLSSKVWDDLSMWNGDFSQTCPAGVHFALRRINELEVAVLTALNYKVKVPASEYAKYYFLLRSMLIKSGLSEGDDMRKMLPLDLEGAKKLELVSSSFQDSATNKRNLAKADTLRSKSMGHAEQARMMQATAGAKTTLEHMVQM